MSFDDKLQMPQKTNANSSNSKQPITIAPPNYQKIIQRAEMHPQSISYADVMVLQKTIGNQAVVRLMKEIGLKNDHSKPVQKVSYEMEEPLQAKKENKTGLPDALKSAKENRSEIDMSDVRVQYSSDKPAQIGALAYKQVKPIQNLVTENGITQLRSGTLSVVTGQHEDSVDTVPRDEDYNIGFIMDVNLDIDEEFPYNTLQDNFELTQYVRDKYDFFNNEGESIDSQPLSEWERDEYGHDNDRGDWNSDENSTSWQDTPGWIGNTVDAGYLLSEYDVDFYFTVKDQEGDILHTSSEINLRAESDDNDNVTYSTQSINETINYDPE